MQQLFTQCLWLLLPQVEASTVASMRSFPFQIVDHSRSTDGVSLWLHAMQAFNNAQVGRQPQLDRPHKSLELHKRDVDPDSEDYFGDTDRDDVSEDDSTDSEPERRRQVAAIELALQAALPTQAAARRRLPYPEGFPVATPDTAADCAAFYTVQYDLCNRQHGERHWTRRCAMLGFEAHLIASNRYLCPHGTTCVDYQSSHNRRRGRQPQPGAPSVECVAELDDSKGKNPIFRFFKSFRKSRDQSATTSSSASAEIMTLGQLLRQTHQ